VARKLAVVLTVGVLLWCALVLLAPPALASGRPQSTAGAALVYQAAGRICHQRPERSFHMAGVPLPVCARCFGLYASGAAGALLGWVVAGGSRRRSRDRGLLLAAALPTAVTFALEFAGLAAFSSATRFAAALPLGLAAGWVFVGALRDEQRLEPAPASHHPDRRLQRPD
jgi:uncharacterized membrane protein